MEEVVRRYNGAVVKTIGDAVMAVFMKPMDALTAACGMIDEFDAFNATAGREEELIIKVGVHVGPCIAVSLNERIDYFGTSVNLAARIQGLSYDRDIMVSDRLFRESNAQELLRGKGWAWEGFSATLKGLQGEQLVYKLAKPY